MKKSSLALLVILLTGAIYIKADRFSSGRFTIYNEKWERTGHITQDYLNPDKFDVYDKDWNRRGHLRRNLE